MDQATLAFIIVSLVIFVYMVGGAIDFGVSLLHAVSVWSRRQGRRNVHIRKTVSDYLSPLWETTNVFLAIGFVGLMGLFPASMSLYGGVMLLPASLGAALLMVRGILFGRVYHDPEPGGAATTLFGLASGLIPAGLMTFFVYSEAGVDTGLLTNPLTYTLGLLAIAYEVLLAASFLAGYAERKGDLEAEQYFRSLLPYGAVAVPVFHLVTLVALRAQPGVESIPAGGGWLFAAGIILAMLGAVRSFRRSTGWGDFALAVTALAAFFAGYAVWHMPYLVRNHATLDQAVVSGPMFSAVLWVLIGGTVVIGPLVAFLYTFFLRQPKTAHE